MIAPGAFEPEAVVEHLGNLRRIRLPYTCDGKIDVGIGGVDHSMTPAELAAIPLVQVNQGLTITLMSEPEMLLIYE